MPYTNRSRFPKNLPRVKTQYCFLCGASVVQKVNIEGRNMFQCATCGKVHERVLIYDPSMAQSFNEKNELVHYSAGIFLLNKHKELLLFLRTKYPFLYTIPAGHISKGEDPKTAALRETEEEVHIMLSDAELIFEGEVRGDECVGGADVQYWHLYFAQTDETVVELDEEGSQYGWFSSVDIPKEITYPVQYFLNQKLVHTKLLS